MLQKIRTLLTRKSRNKKRLHRQFLEVQKWQSEMYNFKTDQDSEKIH